MGGGGFGGRRRISGGGGGGVGGGYFMGLDGVVISIGTFISVGYGFNLN